MRFLIDECLRRDLAEALNHHGHDATHVVDAGLLGAPDPEVMKLAVAERRVLVSADTDFGELLAKSGSSAPSVILFRGQSHEVAHLSRLLIAVLPEVEDDLVQGAVVVVARDRLRVRRLPIGG